MKRGTCPKCQSKEVYSKINGVTTSERKVYVRVSLLTSPSDRETFICTSCGYYENYISDNAALKKVRQKWDKII